MRRIEIIERPRFGHEGTSSLQQIVNATIPAGKYLVCTPPHEQSAPTGAARMSS